MTRDRARRTSSGSTLRLVGSDEPVTGDAADVLGDGATGSQLSTVLPGQRQSVAVGRHWVVRTAGELDVTGMANQVLELLASELLANAVLHGPDGSAVGLQMRRTGEVARVSVSDGGREAPVVLHRAPTALDGRGMAIVDSMSSRWGIDVHGDGGKTVWFELDLADF